MKNFQLVFVPSPGHGHLPSAVGTAKLLLDRDDRLSISILIIKRTSDTSTHHSISSLPKSNRLNLIDLPFIDSAPISFNFIDSYKSHIREAVSKLETSTLAGFVLDMFYTSLIDIANEFNVPSYLFFACNVSFLSLMFHLQILHDENGKNLTEFKNSDDELTIPSFVNSIPARVLSEVFIEEKWMSDFMNISRRYKEVKGIIVNSFIELESHVVNAFSHGTPNAPPVYPVGPILNLNGGDDGKEIIEWLDDQPPSSVVFLCFGSMGTFCERQVKEIAIALENSGHRFLWSLRQPSAMGPMAPPTDYQNFDHILPKEFLDRTRKIGRVIGWAPQVTVLAHKAIGAFVSHCGWNSILESLWYGIPIATWPMYAEQQFNAFQMVKEFGLAVEITVDYRKNGHVIVKSGDIERGIRHVMEHDSEVRMNVKKISEISKNVLIDGGSSFSLLNRFIEDVIHNLS